MNKNDLTQISQLLDEKLNQRLDEKLAPIHKTLESHGKMLESHGKMLESHGKMLESHGKMLRSLKRDQTTMLRMLNTEQMTQKKRIKRIEDHIGLSSQ